MAEYPIFTVGSDGHFVDFTPLFCRDDAEAIAKASRLTGKNDVEVWRGSRLVKKLISPGSVAGAGLSTEPSR